MADRGHDAAAVEDVHELYGDGIRCFSHLYIGVDIVGVASIAFLYIYRDGMHYTVP